MEALISTKGQVVIPKALRDQWGLHAGSSVRFESTASGLRLLPAPAIDVAAVRRGAGLLKSKRPFLRVEEMDPLKALRRA